MQNDVNSDRVMDASETDVGAVPGDIATGRTEVAGSMYDGETDTPRPAPGDEVSSDTEAKLADVEDPGPVSDGATVAAQPTTGIVDTDVARETFIPVSRFALIDRICDPKYWPNGNAEDVKRFFTCLGAIRNLTYTRHLLELKSAYLPFSPDRDTVRVFQHTPEQLSEIQGQLTGLLSTILECANYKLITGQMLEEIFAEKSAYGLDLEVDMGEFDEVMIYSRGATVKVHHYRSWRTLFFKKHQEDVPIFQRLFLLLKLKSEDVRVREIMIDEDVDERQARKRLKKLRRMLPEQASSDYVYLKMFKQIPRADLQMMFPNTKVQFKLKDKLFLGLTAGGGTLASIASAAGKIALVLTNPLKALGAIVGLGAVLFRQVKKFFNQRNQYMMTLAQNLYFHNLADNRGVLALLADRAEEEDIKEEMLLYALLARGALHRDELEDAREAIEMFLWDEFSVSVRFDIHDALQRLVAEGVVTETPDGELETLAAKPGAAMLRRTWAAHLEDHDVREQSAVAA